MTYKEIRDKFVQLSGRYDLTTSAGADNGADFFLNAGQKFLDRLFNLGKMKARCVQEVAAGVIVVKTAGLRAVKEVWVTKSDETKYRLEDTTLSELRDSYGETLTSVDQSDPAYFAPADFRPYPDTADTGTGGEYVGLKDVEDLVLDNAHHTYGGVVIMPPPSETVYVSIEGLFYSPALTATKVDGVWVSAKSFWTEQHPETLLKAALFQLEGFYRNKEGMNDWQSFLQSDVQGLEFDNVEAEIAGDSVMEG